MHFLHSSGVAHCDLKSLNLLLDNKWNLKVSDFGLTKVKSELIKNGPKGGAMGTIHWTAPEVLAESENVDYVLADVRASSAIGLNLLMCVKHARMQSAKLTHALLVLSTSTDLQLRYRDVGGIHQAAALRGNVACSNRCGCAAQ
jgi:serine/threonine protein kinase